MARVVLVLVLGVVVGFVAGRLSAPERLHPARSSQRAPAATPPEQSRDPAVRSTDEASPASATSSGPPTRPDTRLRDDERRMIRRFVRAGYDEFARGKPPPETDLFDAAADEALQATERYRANYTRSVGARLVIRQQQRAELGEISDFPLVLQVLAPGGRTVEASLVTRGASAPFPFAPPPTRGSPATYVRGGTIPPGQTLLVDEVRLRIVVVSRGSAELRLDNCDVFGWKYTQSAAPRAIEMRLAGLQRVEHGREELAELSGCNAAAVAELRGRLVPREEAAKVALRPFVMVGEGKGFLTDQTPLLQVCADHGGGNLQGVRLDGSTDRIDLFDPTDIWADNPDLRSRRRSVTHYENCGLIPPGKAFRITRVTYRVILDKRERTHSRFDIRIGGERVAGNAAERDRIEGEWTGEVLLRPGEEQEVILTCAKFALAEARVFGQLVDAK